MADNHFHANIAIPGGGETSRPSPLNFIIPLLLHMNLVSMTYFQGGQLRILDI